MFSNFSFSTEGIFFISSIMGRTHNNYNNYCVRTYYIVFALLTINVYVSGEIKKLQLMCVFFVFVQVAIIVINGLFLFWLIKGTDRDCRPSNYSNFPAGDEGDYDDKIDEVSPEPTAPSTSATPQYTPPEY